VRGCDVGAAQAGDSGLSRRKIRARAREQGLSERAARAPRPTQRSIALPIPLRDARREGTASAATLLARPRHCTRRRRATTASRGLWRGRLGSTSARLLTRSAPALASPGAQCSERTAAERPPPPRAVADTPSDADDAAPGRPRLLAKPRRRHLSPARLAAAAMPHTVGAPAPTAARQGRERQKYGDDGARLVAGCVPVRFLGGRREAAAARVLLITSRGGRGYVFPKGGWELDETVETAALRETVEEAGVRGALELPSLGAFPFAAGKPGPGAVGRRCVAHMFALRVSEELPVWPEAAARERRWCTLEDAHALCRYDWMRQALRAWVRRKGWAVAWAAPGALAGGAPPPPAIAADGSPPPPPPPPPGVAVRT
jgi:diphosphoinositol-polyphosphate diphosphatase